MSRQALRNLLSTLKGFTLAELIVSLAIIGVVATFTIPKVLQANQNAKYVAMGKEAASILSGAYQAYKQDNAPTGSMTSRDLMPYINYSALETVSPIDSYQNDATLSWTCTSVPSTCLRLHNGAILKLESWRNFGGTANTNVVWALFDPDGKVTDGTTNGPGRSVFLGLYFNGRITTYGTCASGTTDSNGTHNPTASNDPPWFSWN